MPGTSDLPAYRWTVVFASALILAVSMGSIVNGMSAYIVPIEDAYGWDRGDIALINVAGIIGLAAGGLIMGPQADKRAYKKPTPATRTEMSHCSCVMPSGIGYSGR